MLYPGPVHEGHRPTTATVLFSDVVGSTAARSAVGEERADATRRHHDEMSSSVVAENGGRIVKFMGDGIMATFEGAADAITAAVELQQRAQTIAGDVPVRLRVGLSAGDVVWDGDDCHGTTVNEAARLCDAAAPGEILISEAVRLLGRGRGDHEFEPRGEIELKGLPEPVVASAVIATPIDASTPLPPPLRTEGRNPFAGRDRDLKEMLEEWDAARVGNRRLTLVSGEPGAGKTRLTAEVAQAAAASGATVLYGRCDDELGLPYQPFVEALGAVLARVAPAEWATHLGPKAGELARLSPRISTERPDLTPSGDLDSETAQYRLFDAVIDWLRAEADRRPVMLVLDDLHWAGQPTLLLLRHVLRVTADERLLIVGTYRDTDLDRSHPLSGLLADFSREHGVVRIDLRGLDEEGVLDFVAAAAGRAPDEGVRQLAAALSNETDGNPFFLGEVLRHLVDSGALVRRDDRWQAGIPFEEFGIPQGVRDVVSRRLDQLSPAANDALRAAAVLGLEFDHQTTVALSGLEEAAAENALAEAVTAGLIHEVPRLRYRFDHALVRATLTEELTTAQKVRLHRQAGTTLEARLGAAVDTHVADLARHFLAASPAGEAEKAVHYSRAAGAQAMDRLAFAEAVTWYEQANDALADHPERDRLEAAVLVDLAGALAAVGDERTRETVLRAHRLAEEAGDIELMVAALNANSRGFGQAYGRHDEERAAALETTIAAAGDDHPWIAALLAELWNELLFAPSRAAETDQIRTRALELVEHAPPKQRVLANFRLHATVLDPDAVDLDALDRLAAESGEVDGPTPYIYSSASRAAMFLGARAEYERFNEAAVAALEATSRPELRWTAMLQRAGRAFLGGRLDETREFAEEAAAIGRSAGAPEAELSLLLADHLVAELRGDITAVRDRAETLLASYQPLMACWLTALRATAGDLEGADEAFAPIVAHPHGELQGNWPWTSNAAAMVQAGVLTGHLDPVRVGYEALLGHEDRLQVSPPHLPLRPLATAMGVGALWLDRPDDALTHFQQARTVAERMEAPVFRAEAEYWLAATELHRHGEISELRRRQLDDARTTFTDVGATVRLRMCEELSAEDAG